MALSKQDAIDQLLSDVKSKNVTLKLSERGYPNPEKYSFNGKNSNSKSFVPDMEAVYENKSDIYTIEQSVDKRNLSDSMLKWILFSSVAKQNNGTLYIVCEDSKEDVFQNLLNSKQIVAKVLPIKKGGDK